MTKLKARGKTISSSRKTSSLTQDDYLSAYKLMYESRVLDEKMLVLIRQGKSFFHIGCMGHEAVQVACGKAMEQGTDFLFPYYRDQALCMALGQSAYECLLAFFAKAGDPHGGGRQMPMHYGNKRINIPTSSSSTGTQFLQAVGFAFGKKQQALQENRKNTVTVVTTGDGTTSQGEFYEAISWAAREKAPLVFLVENNRYAISVPIHEQRPGGAIADNFKNFSGLNVVAVDGCNFEQSYKTIKAAIDYARAGLGPTLIDADVVRLLPHSSSDDDKKYRSKEDLAHDKTRDPVSALRRVLIAQKIINERELSAIEHAIKHHIDEEADRALKAPEPRSQDATKHVWADAQVEHEPKITTLQKEPIVMVDAINRALREGLLHDPRILVFGQDVAHGKGGVFTATRKLTEEFGATRCFNAPLAEASIIGVAIGYALSGFRPIPEIQFADYIWTAMMQIRNELATIRYRSNGAFFAPVIIRVPVGGYIHGGLCHSQNIEATFAHFPGLKIALPSTALDAYGLLKNAMLNDDPVLFLEHKALYRQSFARSLLPESSDYHLPFGKGIIRKTGADITIITWGILVQRALEAASSLETLGIDIEVIDLRTIVPYDTELILSSVKKTGKVLILHEDMRFMGFGAELASFIMENCFMSLDAPVIRLAAKDTPVPYSPELEKEILPQPHDIIRALKELASF